MYIIIPLSKELEYHYPVTNLCHTYLPKSFLQMCFSQKLNYIL